MLSNDIIKKYKKEYESGELVQVNFFDLFDDFIPKIQKLESNLLSKERQNEKLNEGFKELLELVYNCADFRNGVDYNGVDEGNIKCWEIIDSICKKYFNKKHNEVLHPVKPYKRIIKGLSK